MAWYTWRLLVWVGRRSLCKHDLRLIVLAYDAGWIGICLEGIGICWWLTQDGEKEMRMYGVIQRDWLLFSKRISGVADTRCLVTGWIYLLAVSGLIHALLIHVVLRDAMSCKHMVCHSSMSQLSSTEGSLCERPMKGPSVSDWSRWIRSCVSSGGLHGSPHEWVMETKGRTESMKQRYSSWSRYEGEVRGS